MRYCYFAFVAIAAVGLWDAVIAHSRAADGPTVQASAIVDAKVVPQTLRMIVPLECTKPSGKEGATHLTEQRDELVNELRRVSFAKIAKVDSAPPTVSRCFRTSIGVPATAPVRSPTESRGYNVIPIAPPPNFAPRSLPTTAPNSPTPATPAAPRLEPVTEPQFAPPAAAPPIRQTIPPKSATQTNWIPSRPFPSVTPVTVSEEGNNPAGVPVVPSAVPGVPNSSVSYRCSLQVTVDWELQAGTLDEAVIAAEELKAEIEESKILSRYLTQTTGAYDPYATSPGIAPYSTSGTAAPPNFVTSIRTPAYMYVAQISPEAKRDALQRAFAKARLRAAELAAAAGYELGEPHFLSSVEPGQRVPATSLPKDAVVIGPTTPPNHNPRTRASDGEVLALDIANLCSAFLVTATFRLK